MGSAKISLPATTQRVTTPVADETCFVFFCVERKLFRMGVSGSAYEEACRELSIGAKKSEKGRRGRWRKEYAKRVGVLQRLTTKKTHLDLHTVALDGDAARKIRDLQCSSRGHRSARRGAPSSLDGERELDVRNREALLCGVLRGEEEREKRGVERKVL